METLKALAGLFLPTRSPIKVGVVPIGWVIAAISYAVATLVK